MPGGDRFERETLDFACGTGTTACHLTGTWRKGPEADAGAVVDDRLRVHGVGALRVAHASNMLATTSANTSAAVLVIDDRVAAPVLDAPPPEPTAPG